MTATTMLQQYAESLRQTGISHLFMPPPEPVAINHHGAKQATLLFISQVMDEQATALFTKMLGAMNTTPEAVAHLQFDCEITQVIPELEAQCKAIDPNAIITLGEPALKTVLDFKFPFHNVCQSKYRFIGKDLWPTYHPQELLNNPALKQHAWQILKQFKTP